MPGKRRNFVSDRSMMLGARDLGLNTDDAIKECADNSLDADADEIHVKVEDNEEYLRIYVEDDGHGIDETIVDDDGEEWDGLTYALSFGGRHGNSDITIGKFGWGLSAAATTQSLETHVYTTTKGEDTWRHNYVDLEEMRQSGDTKLPESEECEVPNHIDLENPDTDSGTVVVFEKCDNPDRKRVNSMVSLLISELSQVYRKYIDAGRMITVNGNELDPKDPLYMIEGCHNPGDIPLVDEPYHEETITVKDPYSDEKHDVTVRIVWLDVEAIRSKDEWDPQWMRKNSLTQQNQGFSLIRNGREIDRGLALNLFTKHGDKNYMRGEIVFPPALDQYFGIQTNKSRFSLKSPIKDKIKEAVGGVPNQVHRKTRETINQLKAEANKNKDETEKSVSEEVAEKADKLLKPRKKFSTEEEEQIEKRVEEKKQAAIEEIEEDDNLDEEEKQEEIERIEKTYDSWLTDPFKVTPEKVPTGQFYEAEFRGKQAHVKINTGHPFHDLYSKFRESDDTDRDRSEAGVTIDLMLLAAAHAELRYQDNDDILRALDVFQDEWSLALKQFLKHKPNVEAESIQGLTADD